MKKLVILIIAMAFVACKNETKTIDTKLETTIDTVKEIDVDNLVIDKDVIDENGNIVFNSIEEEVADLRLKGFKIKDVIDDATNDTIIMQKYFMVFLKRGVIHNQNEEEAALLHEEHLAYLKRMYELGYTDISGPFEGEGDLRAATIYNVPTLKIADSLAKVDPIVKSGRLQVEIHPWWAVKGNSLR
ncbi:YciI family protein [Lacinutrix undariae]